MISKIIIKEIIREFRKSSSLEGAVIQCICIRKSLFEWNRRDTNLSVSFNEITVSVDYVASTSLVNTQLCDGVETPHCSKTRWGQDKEHPLLQVWPRGAVWPSCWDSLDTESELRDHKIPGWREDRKQVGAIVTTGGWSGVRWHAVFGAQWLMWLQTHRHYGCLHKTWTKTRNSEETNQEGSSESRREWGTGG